MCTFWRCPLIFMATDRHVFTGEECFLIFLHHMKKGVPFTDMARHPFGGDPRRYSSMFDLMVDHLYFTSYYVRLQDRSLT